MEDLNTTVSTVTATVVDAATANATVTTTNTVANVIVRDAFGHLAEPPHKDLVAFIRELVLREELEARAASAAKLTFRLFKGEFVENHIEVLYIDTNTRLVLHDTSFVDSFMKSRCQQEIVQYIRLVIDVINNYIIKPTSITDAKKASDTMLASNMVYRDCICVRRDARNVFYCASLSLHIGYVHFEIYFNSHIKNGKPTKTITDIIWSAGDIIEIIVSDDYGIHRETGTTMHPAVIANALEDLARQFATCDIWD
jgi:hypothetical protein